MPPWIPISDAPYDDLEGFMNEPMPWWVWFALLFLFFGPLIYWAAQVPPRIWPNI